MGGGTSAFCNAFRIAHRFSNVLSNVHLRWGLLKQYMVALPVSIVARVYILLAFRVS